MSSLTSGTEVLIQLVHPLTKSLSLAFSLQLTSEKQRGLEVEAKAYRPEIGGKEVFCYLKKSSYLCTAFDGNV